MKVLVAGAGAIGQWLGARLTTAGHDVTLLARAANAAALRDGLNVRGNTTFTGPLRVVTTPAEAGGRFDAVAITGKAHQTATLAEATAPLVAPNGVLLSLQNGLGNAQKLLRFAPAERVAIGLTSHGVMVEAPGKLYHAGVGPTLVGPALPPGDAAARKALALLKEAGLEPEWHAEMRPFVWRKAIVNAGINPVGALHGVRNGEIAARDDLLQLARGLVEEGVALAQRARVQLPPGDLAAAMEETLRRTADNKCSMLQDREAKRPTEVEQITGRMVRLGERLLVSMPRSDAVYGRVKDLESAYLGHEAANRMAWDELDWEKEPF